MSSEVCPFCGKTFKRLKSHLPHCKAAANSQTPPTTQDATVLSKTTTKEKKPKQLSPMATDQPPKKSKKVSAHASQSEQLATATSSGLASTLMANKKKQKKLKETASSASPSSALPKPEKKSLRTLIEEAKPVANVKETKSASKDSSLSKSSNHTESKVAPESFHDVFSGTKVKKQPKMKYVVCGWNPLDSNVGPDQSSLRRIKENVWVDGDGEDMEGLTDIGGHQGKVTLQDVKSTLGRTTSRRQSSILSRITAADQMKLDVDPSPLPLPVETQKQETTQSDKQLSVKESGAPPSVQHQLLSSAAQGGRSRLAEPLLSAPSNQPSSHLQFPRMVEDLQLDVRRQNQLIEGLATRRHVGQVRLKELPDWLLSRTPRRPRDAVEMMQRGWLWYYRRYIDVKKGGVGGLSMLLAGYCVLSYVWSYPHLKSSRWRKYH